MEFRFYNSFSKKLEKFTPAVAGQVKIYSCGPTVYDFAHIGNFRSYVFADILRRSLRYGGYEVSHAMNITDVDDKTIKRTLEKNPDPEIADLKDFTKTYTDAFFDDLKKIGIDPFNHHPQATDYLESMVGLVELLEKKGLAYHLDGSVYFSISKFKDYGKLSGVDLSSVKSGTRYNADEYSKEDVRDFVLWKSEKKQEKIAWDTPLGRGRPGWHLECSAMIQSIFKGPIDIHTGGVDLMFPHHENEIAQSVNAYGHGFVRYWMHCEHLLVNGRKMSKSEGNFFTLRDIMKAGYHPKAVRYFLLSSHYRQKINFTMETLEQTLQSLKRINIFFKRLSEVKSLKASEPGGASLDTDLVQKIEAWKKAFLEELQDDLNTPRALAVFHDAMKYTNRLLDESGDQLNSTLLQDLNTMFDEFNSVLNLKDPDLADNAVSETPDEIKEWLRLRDEARKNKDYAMSDQLRDKISEAGFVIIDTPSGSQLQKKPG